MRSSAGVIWSGSSHEAGYEEQSPSAGAELRCKVVVLGDSGVGKTAIVARFVAGTFANPRQGKTPAVASASAAHASSPVRHRKTVKAPSGASVTLHIGDTAGEAKYRTVQPVYYKTADVVVVVFDLSDAVESLQHATSLVKEVRSVRGTLPVVVAGNKADCCAGRGRDLTADEAQARAFCRSVGAPYFSVSAKTGDGVAELFAAVAAQAPLNRRTHSPARDRQGLTRYSSGRDSAAVSKSREVFVVDSDSDGDETRPFIRQPDKNCCCCSVQ